MADIGTRPLRLIIANSSRKWIGEAAHCFLLYHKLKERGHAPLLVVREGWELESRAKAADMDVVSLHFKSQFSPYHDWRDIRQIQRLVRERSIDLVHCHRGKDHWIGGIALALMPKDCRPPLLRTRHVVTPVSSNLFNRWLYGRTRWIISVSNAAQAGFSAPNRRWFRRSLAEKSSIIHSGVDTLKFSPDKRSEAWRRKMGLEEGDVLIGHIGRFQRVKGQWEFLRSTGVIARDYPRAWFLLAGRGTDKKRQRYRLMAESLGIEDRFILLGELDDIATVIASLDISVVPSLGSEGSSRIVLESMASGRPIVASRVGGIPDMIDDGVTGRLVAPGDVAALSATIRELLKSPEKRRRLGEAARSRAEEYFNLDRWIGQVEAVYRKVLANPH